MTTRFGAMLRGARLGFQWSRRHQALIRISIVSDELLRIEVAPPDYYFEGNDKVETHVCWWERGSAEGEEVLNMCDPLRDKTGPWKRETYIVDNEGKLWG